MTTEPRVHDEGTGTDRAETSSPVDPFAIVQLLTSQSLRQKAKAKGGRPLGSVTPMTEFIQDLVKSMKGVKPALIVEEIYRRAEAGDTDCPFELDISIEDALLEESTLRTLKRAEIKAAVYRARYEVKKFAENQFSANRAS